MIKKNVTGYSIPNEKLETGDEISPVFPVLSVMFQVKCLIGKASQKIMGGDLFGQKGWVS